MDITEATKRLCSLVTEVGGKQFNHAYAHDCFCGGNLYPGERVDDPIIEFIEKSVREAIEPNRQPAL